MTISAYSPSGPFTGNAVVGQAFTVSFEFFATSEIVVTTRVTATGVEATLVETTDYTVATTGSSPFTGATVTLVGSLAATSTVLFTRTTDQVQETDYVEGGPFPAETTEDQLDKDVMMSQENRAQLDRIPKVPITDDTPGPLPNAIDRAGGFAAYDDNGDPTVISSVLPDDAVVSAFIEANLLPVATAAAAAAAINALSLDDTDTFGLTIVDAATAAAARGLLELDTDDDVEFADVTATDLITKGPWVDPRAFGTLTSGVSQAGSVQTANVAAIQAAVDSLVNGGGTVLIPTGTFELNSSVSLSDNTYANIRVTGMGRATILKATGNTHIIEVTGSGEGGVTLGLVGVQIDHLKFEGPDSGTSAAIYAVDVHECNFSNNWICEPGKGTFYGIQFLGSVNNDTDNCTIRENYIRGTVDDGINMVTNGPDVHGACEENVVSGNVLTGCGGSGIKCTGQKNTFSNNTIEECAETGIVIGGDHNTVVANTCCQNAQNGISLELAAHAIYGNTVVGNICRDNDLEDTATYHGINLITARNSTVVGNICVNNDGNEINISAGTFNNLIVGNNVAAETPDHEGTIVDAGTNTRLFGNYTGADTTIASPAGGALTLHIDGNYFNITGTNNITSIATSWVGRIVTLKFEAGLTISDGNNLKLAGDFTTVGTADTLSLVHDGTSYFETSRSDNT